MPLDCDEVPAPTAPRSRTTTSRAPRAARWYAIDTPITPAPTTIASWACVITGAEAVPCSSGHFARQAPSFRAACLLPRASGILPDTKHRGRGTHDAASLLRDGVVVSRQRPSPRELLERAAARRRPRRGQAGRPRRRFVQALRRRLLPRHGRRRQARAGRDRRPQHVARLERRQRPLLG